MKRYIILGSIFIIAILFIAGSLLLGCGTSGGTDTPTTTTTINATTTNRRPNTRPFQHRPGIGGWRRDRIAAADQRAWTACGFRLKCFGKQIYLERGTRRWRAVVVRRYPTILCRHTSRITLTQKKVHRGWWTFKSFYDFYPSLKEHDKNTQTFPTLQTQTGLFPVHRLDCVATLNRMNNGNN